MIDNQTLILGAYGTGNIGDEAVLAGILRQIKSARPSDKVIVFSYNPEETERIHNCPSLKATLLSPLTYKTILGSKRLIIGGGGIIHNYKHHAAYLCLWALIAKILGKRVEFYGVGVEKVNSITSKVMIPLVMNMIDSITVRDQLSKTYLESAGVKKTIQVIYYPEIDLRAVTPEIAKIFLKKEGIKRNKKIFLGLALRYTINDEGMVRYAINDKLKKSICQVIDWFLEEYPSKVVFIPMCNHPLAWFEKDRLLAQELWQMVKEKAKFYVLRGRYTPEQIMGIIGQMDFLIGMRLHSLIFAFSMGIPFLGISYSEKIDSFLKIIQEKAYPLTLLEAEEIKGTILRKLKGHKQHGF